MIQVIEWRPAIKNSFQGNFDIIVPKWGGFIIRDMCYFKKENQRWVSFPNRSFEVDGKKKYRPYCTFHETNISKLFLDKVINALDEFFKNQK